MGNTLANRTRKNKLNVAIVVYKSYLVAQNARGLLPEQNQIPDHERCSGSQQPYCFLSHFQPST